MANRKYTGIEIRHQADCASQAGRRCNCRPGYRAEVWSPRDEKRVRKTFPTLDAAKAWRADILGGVRRGQVTAKPTPALDRAAEEWLAGAAEGRIRNRSGDPYKPSALRGYEQALRLRILPQLGGLKLADI